MDMCIEAYSDSGYARHKRENNQHLAIVPM